MPALSKPLSQIGCQPDEGQRFLSPYELANLFNNPGFYEAANLAREHGAQFHFKGKKRNTAAHELIEKCGRASKMHAQEEQAAAVLRSKQERSRELASFC